MPADLSARRSAPAGDCSPLVITGAPRSGTSLIYNLFDGHPEVNWLVDEGFLFEYLDDMGPAGADLFLDAIPVDLNALVAGLRDKQVMPPVERPYRQSRDRGSVSDVEIQADWDEECFIASLAQPARGGVCGLWLRLAHAYLAGMRQDPRRYCCLKAPDYGKSAASALASIPDARAIVIVRDPISSLDSLKRSRELRGEKLLTWPLLAQNVRNFQRLLDRIDTADPDRTRVVRYESLVAEPEPTMRALADWLEIAFDPCLLQPTMRGQHWPGISSFKATDGIETSAARRPVLSLDEAEVDLVTRHLAGFRMRFGYGPT
ncbi:MAG: sulfotransferase [Alphaproteobacteria bacterium]